MTNNFGATSISVPTDNIYLMGLFLPYMMLANLLLPLFLGSKNLIIIISSIENLYFLYITLKYLMHRRIWRILRRKISLINFFMIYFLVGLAFLGMINTNLGLAMREKMMYVPAFLIIVMLVYSYKRIIAIRDVFSQIDRKLPEMSPIAS